MDVEVRIRFTDPAKALERLLAIGKVIEEYQSTDVFFQPQGVVWDFEKQNLRLRRNVKGGQDTVSFIYREVEWYRGSKKFKVEWKYTTVDSLEKAVQILNSWGMKEIIRYKKLGRRFQTNEPKHEIYYEEIEHIGPLAEIERATKEEVDQALTDIFTGIDYEVVSQSVPTLVKQKLV